MPNSIRTPRQGLSETSRRIAEAVDDESWQRFRLSLKGISTREKLALLCGYYNQNIMKDGAVDEDVRIRVDNYIKALARGGQLYSGESLTSVIGSNWNPPVKKV